MRHNLDKIKITYVIIFDIISALVMTFCQQLNITADFSVHLMKM